MNRFTISLLGLSLFALAGCNTFFKNIQTDRPVVQSDVSKQPSFNGVQLTRKIEKRLVSLDAIFTSDNATQEGKKGENSSYLKADNELERLKNDLENLERLIPNNNQSTIIKETKVYNSITELQDILSNSPEEVQEKYNEVKTEAQALLKEWSERFSPSEQTLDLNNISSQERDSKEKDDVFSSNEPHSILLPGSSLLISILSLFFALRASLRAKDQGDRLQGLQKEMKDFKQKINYDILKLYKTQATQPKPTNTKEINIRPTATQSKSESIAPPIVDYAPQAATIPIPSVPVGPNIKGLVDALNNGDRQKLKAAASAELNITSDSQSQLAIGKSIATELEVVPGGGSYWLIRLQGQAWLFPTEGTLRGFEVEQPAKGIFTYQQQIISKAQLLEPAALEGSGNLWRVKTMGSVATP